METDITLRDLIADLPEAHLTGDDGVEIAQLEYDSRLVQPHALFFAVTGFKQDGYDYVSQAIDRGATAVMGERESITEQIPHVQVPSIRTAMAATAARFYGHPSDRLDIIGVTGTNGKTTTCYMLRRILEATGDKVGLITTQLYDTGGETFKAERTTPESLDIQRLLFLMVSNLCERAVIEVSSHALTLNRVDQVSFRVAVYTNLTRDHLDYHGDMESYAQAKFELARKLDGSPAAVAINLDVEEFRPLFGELDCRTISYSLDNREADLYCGARELRPDGTLFDLVTDSESRTVNLPLPGRFNLQNAMAAAAGGLAAGVDLDTVVNGLEKCHPIPGRLNRIDCGQPFSIYIDYAHTPDALSRLCETVREVNPGRLLLLFGCGGDRDKGKRPMMGEAATTAADYCVVTSDNPRSEDPVAIIDDVKPGLQGDRYAIEPERAQAIKMILKAAQPGDAVLLAGKGAEPYQEVNGVKHPYSDFEQTKSALADLGFTKK